MELQHFAHKHPLTLLSEEINENSKRETCSGCGKRILGACFRCTVCGLFSLHKSCAELPTEMNHFGHPDHPLTLFLHKMGRYGVRDPFVYCDACYCGTRGLVYQCSPCEFYLHIGCAQLAQTAEHKLLHRHPLSLQLKASDQYRCDACGTRSEERLLSYQCASCHFWVHPKCVSLPSSIEHTSHLHPLTLVSSSDKPEISRFQIYCQICDGVVRRKDCAYYCAGCRYFVHVGCATSRRDTMRGEIERKDPPPSNLICLPMPDESSSLHLLNHLLEKVSPLPSNQSGRGLEHSRCDHQLTLFDAQIDGNCDACVLPISAPHYKCSKCHLILHKSCAELPTEIGHRWHGHPLHLLHRDHYTCHACGCVGNGFAYCCELGDCSFDLDIKCASLPTTIRHEAHDHLLSLDIARSPNERCNACYQGCEQFSFKCYACNFNLHIQCALLPRTLRHRYDRHAIILKYSPVGIKYNEYCCEICEEDVNTNIWFYFCADCDYAFHCGCIYKAFDRYANVKLGAIIDVENHTHSLTLAGKAVDKMPSCDQCGDLCDKIGFECKECQFNLHFQCGFEKRKL